MSFFEWVTDSVDSVTDKGEAVFNAVSNKAENVKEYFVGDDEQVANEIDGVAGTNQVTQDRQPAVNSKPVNWSAIGVGVSALALLAKFIK